jgi:hypothetical protein
MKEDQCKAALQQIDDDRKMDRIDNIIHRVEKLNYSCEDNMKRLHSMMLELKGLIAMVRPQVKKTGWYGEEIEAEGKYKTLEIELNTVK